MVLTNTLAVPGPAVAAALLHIPHVWYLREFGLEDHGLQYDYGPALSLGLIDRLSRLIICNSRALQEHFAHHLTPAKLRLVYNSIEVPGTAGDPPRAAPFQVVLLGSIVRSKGQDVAVRALGLLRARGLDVRLTIVGPASQAWLAELRSLASELNVEDAVLITAYVPEPFAYVAGAHVALMCSRQEAFGRITVEAMKLGRPVIGADTGGTVELIRPGETGLLFRQGDAHHLAGQIETLYGDRELARRVGERARMWACRTFTVENYARDLEAVLEAAA